MSPNRMNKVHIGVLLLLILSLIISIVLIARADSSQPSQPETEETTTMTTDTITSTITSDHSTTTAMTTTTETTTTSTTTQTTTVTTTETTTIAATIPATEAPTEIPETEPPVTETQTVTETTPPPSEPPEDTAELTYINGILIVNKTYALPSDYNPGMDPTCQAQFDALSAAAAAEGLNIYFSSGFRSYEYQGEVYNSFLAAYGQEKTDTLSARPGHSEHQTGLAIDVNTINDAFANTAEAVWLAEHAHEFGFIIRYPKGKEHITGYKYEPWHIRYLGVETATKVYESGLTLEEYLGITSCYAD